MKWKINGRSDQSVCKRAAHSYWTCVPYGLCIPIIISMLRLVAGVEWMHSLHIRSHTNRVQAILQVPLALKSFGANENWFITPKKIIYYNTIISVALLKKNWNKNANEFTVQIHLFLHAAGCWRNRFRAERNPVIIISQTWTSFAAHKCFNFSIFFIPCLFFVH